MTANLRDDEEFVISKLAAAYSGEWWPGEDPPDAYMRLDDQIIAVEISTLTQHVTDDHGKPVPRLKQDTVGLRICDELDQELSNRVPEGIVVVLILRSPIKSPRRFKPMLAQRIVELLTTSGKPGTRIRADICANKVEISLVAGPRSSGAKVVGAVPNEGSDANILKNAIEILDERISVKAEKCRSLSSKYNVWLALFNDYWLASIDTYRQAIALSAVPHIFEKILLVSGKGIVEDLHV